MPTALTSATFWLIRFTFTILHGKVSSCKVRSLLAMSYGGQWPPWTKVEAEKKSADEKEYKEELVMAHQKTADKRRRVKDEVPQEQAWDWSSQDWKQQSGWESSSGSTTKKDGDWKKDWNVMNKKEDIVMDDTPQGKGGVASASSAATYVDNGGGAEVAAAMIVDDGDDWNLVQDPKVSMYSVPNPIHETLPDGMEA